MLDFTAGQSSSARGYISSAFNQPIGTLHSFTSDLFLGSDAIYHHSSGGAGPNIAVYLDGIYNEEDAQSFELSCAHQPNYVFRPMIVSENTYVMFRNSEAPADFFVVGSRYTCNIHDAN